MTALLGDMVAAWPDRPAVVDDRGTTTWAELDDRVTRLVQALRRCGLGEGDTVAAVVGNQAEAVEVSLGCATGGWVLVPVNWHWVADEVAYVLDDCDAAAVVADVRWLDTVSKALDLTETAAPRARLAIAGTADGFDDYEAALSAADGGELVDPVKGGPMFYTSGTTGRPKGVRSSLASVGGPPELFTLIAHSFRPLIDLPDDGAVQLICGPLYHSAQWVFAHFSLLCGATVVLQHRFDAAGVLDLIDAHSVTNVHLVPTQMKRMLDLPDERRAAFDGSSLVSVIHGAAPCPSSVKRAMIDWLGPVVTEYYGGTEGGFLARITAEEWSTRPGSVGRPVDIVEVRVLDDSGRQCGPGEPGDIWFRNLMGSDFEYHNAPDKTASSHREGFATLGDIGHLDDDGYLYLSDRRIDMIVSGGVNIYPAEIEGVLAAHPAVADVAVFGVPDDEMGEQVKAAVVLAPGASWDDALEDDLVAHCRRALAGYKQPRSFDVHDELPRLASGKLTKRALREPYWQGREDRDLMPGAPTLTRRGLLGRRILRRVLYSQMQLRNAAMIIAGKDTPLVRFTVEADPPSIYLVFRIRDVDALAAHLALPAPLELAPIRCIEGDEPEHYLTLNVYRVSGITNGRRAEWSVYATDGGDVPRYVVVDARSSGRSMDPVDIVTPASRVDHERAGDRITTVVGPAGEELSSAFSVPPSAPAVVTAREWSSANDVIYWRNGIRDRTFYDAGMADAAVVSVDPESIDIDDRTPWAAFVEPRPAHVLVFREAIELVVSPWDNVDSLST